MNSEPQPQGLFAAISPEEAVRRVALARNAVVGEVQKVVVGHEDLIELALIALLAKGHCLLVGVPGAARSLTLSTLARVLHLRFSHVPLTPDMTPEDLAGKEVSEFNEQSKEAIRRVVRGPVFAGFIVADEIDNAAPKTQSALLHLMRTGQVIVAGKTYELQPPFLIAATQNEIGRQHAHPLSETQLDQFIVSEWFGYPSDEEERAMVARNTQSSSADVQIVLRTRDILWIRQIVKQIPATQHILDYAVDLVRATRPDEPSGPSFVKTWVDWGAGPRASEQLVLAAKARALIKGRHIPHAADVRAVARAVLRHRIFTSQEADRKGITSEQVVERS